MNTALLMEEFTQFLDKTMGLHFRKESWPLFTKKFMPAVKDFGFTDETQCMQWLMTSPLTDDHIAILAHHLTVGETYFFRDTHAFEKLERIYLPQIIEKKAKEDKHIRIWSAACCTGEEPYSIAMTLKKMIRNIDEWHISILATDINPHFLKSAKEGVFRPWSFRATPDAIKKLFFTEEKRERWSIDSSIKSMVHFDYLNLVDDTYPSLLNGTNAMDLILCNNVLIYFQESTIDRVIEKMTNSLVPDGWLLVTPVESPYVKNDHLQLTDSAFRKTVIAQKIEKQEMIPPPIKPVLYFENVQKKSPKPDQVPVIEENKALLLYENGKYDEVIDLLKNKQDIDSILLVSKSYGNKGLLDKALDWCNRALLMDKTEPLIYYLKSNIEQELLEINEAISSLKKAIYLDSQFVIAHLNLGNLLREIGDEKSANKHYRNALTTLKHYKEDDIVPNSEGLTAGILKEIITTTQGVNNE